VTPCLDLAIWRSQHVMVRQKAATELWGIPCTHARVIGTSLEADILEREQLLLLSNVFVSHEQVKMDRDFFWKMIQPRKVSGSPCNHDKTTIPHMEHEMEMIDRIIRGNTVNCNELETSNDDVDNDLSAMTNAESICTDNTEQIMRGIDSDVDSDSELGEDECAARLALTIQRLGNMSRKPINKIATMDLYVSGHILLEKTIRKARLTLLKRRQRKQELFYNLMKYFSAQMAKCNEQLHCSMERSADQTAVYAAPLWKQKNYKNRMANYND
jgi:hypothetical protein